MNKKFVYTIIAIIVAVILIFAVIKISGNNNVTDIKGLDNGTSDNNGLTVTVTFPEGYTVTQIADKLEENGVCSAKDFLKEVNNPSKEFAEKYGIVNTDDRIFVLEGYVFPDTYEFYKGEDAESVLKRFTDNFSSKISDSDVERANELGFSVDEVLRIASIVQEEAGLDSQNKKVSSAIHNRLKSGMKIQCDVSIDYLTKYCEPYLKNGLTEENKQNYNTYKCSALPSGPITNPGYSAIQAALYPADTDYLYFVTDKEMNYYYASTWEDHVKNCQKAGIEQ